MMRRTPRIAAERPGYVLFIVMIVIVVLSLVAYQYADAMSSERAASHRALEVDQARANANSGIGWILGLLANSEAPLKLARRPEASRRWPRARSASNSIRCSAE